MKTNSSHGYHGITLRNDAYGWTIQLKLLGKYRQLRTYASSAEQAARRHDVALSKLEAFVETNAQPNFPDDFASVSISRESFDKNDGGIPFFNDLSELFSSLCKEAELAGLDPIELANHKREAAAHRNKEREMKRDWARVSLSQYLIKCRRDLSSLGLSADKLKQLSDMLDQTIRILNSAS